MGIYEDVASCVTDMDAKDLTVVNDVVTFKVNDEYLVEIKSTNEKGLLYVLNVWRNGVQFAEIGIKTLLGLRKNLDFLVGNYGRLAEKKELLQQTLDFLGAGYVGQHDLSIFRQLNDGYFIQIRFAVYGGDLGYCLNVLPVPTRDMLVVDKVEEIPNILTKEQLKDVIADLEVKYEV